LRLPDRRLARQNLEPEGLTRKILANKGLAAGLRPLCAGDFGELFSFWFCKILILLMLEPMYRRLSLQNIEPEGLTRKILWNKGLVVDAGLLFRTALRKILILLQLLSNGWALWRQNIAG
jgi:hypothetical protein